MISTVVNVNLQISLCLGALVMLNAHWSEYLWYKYKLNYFGSRFYEVLDSLKLTVFLNITHNHDRLPTDGDYHRRNL